MTKDKLKKIEKLSHKIIRDFFMNELKEIELDFGLINITQVKLSSDISYLDIYVSSFKNQDILCKTLAKYAQEILRAINKNIKIFKMPKIRFRYDKSGEIGEGIIKTINSLKKF